MMTNMDICTITGAFASVIAAGTGICGICQNFVNNRKANPMIKVLCYEGGTTGAAVVNYGKCYATNIRITFPDYPKMNFGAEDLAATTIYPGQQFNIRFAAPQGVRSLNYTIEWQDKLREHNVAQLTTQIL